MIGIFLCVAMEEFGFFLPQCDKLTGLELVLLHNPAFQALTRQD